MRERTSFREEDIWLPAAQSAAGGGRHASFHRFVREGRFKIVPMKGCRTSVSIQANADAIGVDATANNCSHPVGKSWTPGRTQRTHSNTIANGKVRLHGRPS